MRINKRTCISTSSILLVPYLPQHVPRYHEWMQQPSIQSATASDPLTLQQEYTMQASWRADADKLTFIVCKPRPDIALNPADKLTEGMIGDVNLFITIEDSEDETGEEIVTGELEVMIAEKVQQGKGYGRAAVLAFLLYIVTQEKEILREFCAALPEAKPGLVDGTFEFFRVKIGKENAGSIKLFEQLGFRKVRRETNYFGEYELRRKVNVWDVEAMMGRYRVGGWRELQFSEGQES